MGVNNPLFYFNQKQKKVFNIYLQKKGKIW